MSDEPIVKNDSLTQEAAREAALEKEQLVAAIVGGDREAERAFVERYLGPVRALLVARSRNPDLASDLVQDVMIEAICALRRDQLREAGKLSSFVIAIARNVLNSHFRGESRRPASLELPDNLPALPSNLHSVEDAEREALALRAIASLEPLDRSILQLTLIDGLKPGVIAERLGLGPDVVRQRKLRATRRVIEFVRRQSQSDAGVHIVSGRKK